MVVARQVLDEMVRKKIVLMQLVLLSRLSSLVSEQVTTK